MGIFLLIFVAAIAIATFTIITMVRKRKNTEKIIDLGNEIATGTIESQINDSMSSTVTETNEELEKRLLNIESPDKDKPFTRMAVPSAVELSGTPFAEDLNQSESEKIIYTNTDKMPITGKASSSKKSRKPKKRNNDENGKKEQ